MHAGGTEEEGFERGQPVNLHTQAGAPQKGMVAGDLQAAAQDPAAALPHLDYLPVAVHGKGGTHLRLVPATELSPRESGAGDAELRRFIDSPPCHVELKALAREHALQAASPERHWAPRNARPSSGFQGGRPPSGPLGGRPPMGRQGKAAR